MEELWLANAPCLGFCFEEASKFQWRLCVILGHDRGSLLGRPAKTRSKGRDSTHFLNQMEPTRKTGHSLMD